MEVVILLIKLLIFFTFRIIEDNMLTLVFLGLLLGMNNANPITGKNNIDITTAVVSGIIRRLNKINYVQTQRFIYLNLVPLIMNFTEPSD